MPADASGVQVNRHCSTIAGASSHARPISGFCPMSSTIRAIASVRTPMRRLQPPFAGIPMIVTFGPSIDIINGDLPTERGVFRSFLAGLHDVHVLTEYEGEQTGFQVNFTLFGAYRFLNITMSDIANRCIDLGDLLGDAAADQLVGSLQDTADWPARFDLMDRFLLERLRRGRPMSPMSRGARACRQAAARSRSAGSAAISNAAARPLSSASMPRWA